MIYKLNKRVHPSLGESFSKAVGSVMLFTVGGIIGASGASAVSLNIVSNSVPIHQAPVTGVELRPAQLTIAGQLDEPVANGIELSVARPTIVKNVQLQTNSAKQGTRWDFYLQ